MWNEGRSWGYIFAALPSRSEGIIRVRCSTKFKSDLVQGPVVFELEEGPIASLTLGLLYRRRSNRQVAAMMTIQVMEIRTSAAKVEIQARPSRADGQTWTGSACWYTRKRACLGTGSTESFCIILVHYCWFHLLRVNSESYALSLLIKQSTLDMFEVFNTST
jgi:hypothetical protein